MAFNPFTSFRKYQKFWMATVLLLCMMTFVLCTGVGGDLSDRIIGWFRRNEGNVLARVNGRAVYGRDLNHIRDQRNTANEFMKRACDTAIKNMNLQMNDKKLTGEERQKKLGQFFALKSELEHRLTRQRYFGSGVKLDELVDFLVWKEQADRLNIDLLPNHVEALVFSELLPEVSKFSYDQMHNLIRDLRPTARSITYAMVIQALSDEYRVLMAQQALEYFDRQNIIRNPKFPKLESSSDPQVRLSLSPGMLYESFKANRSQFDVAIVEVPVDLFTSQVGEPTESELKSLFAAHQKDRYDPSAPTPGFEIPSSTRVEMVVGDPTDAKFKQWSHLGVLLEATPPVWLPSSHLSLVARYGAGPLAQREVLEFQYRQVRNRFPSSSWAQADFYDALARYLAGKHPEAAASWIAGHAQPTNLAAHLGFLAFAKQKHPRELAEGLKIEVKKRVPVYATWLLANGPGTPLQALGMWTNMTMEDQYLPLDVVKEEVTKFLERRLAENWVNKNMTALRKLLEDPNNIGKKANFIRALNKNVAALGLERRATKDLHDRFSIEKAPELAPLYKSYEKWYENINRAESRDLAPETLLKDSDFYKLFFDSTESFSVAGSTYKAKPWPPRVTPKKLPPQLMFDPTHDPTKPIPPIELFETAEKPILFWKVEDRLGKVPESLAAVRERVANAWKFQKARREKAMPRAKEIADNLQKSEEGFGPVLAIEGLKKTPIVDLHGLAPMYADPDNPPPPYTLPKAFRPGERKYGPYPIPKDKFVYPRDDMSAQLLSLADLKKPIEIADPINPDPIGKMLDDINKTLFDIGSKNGRIVQVLTNKPQSTFYVACLKSNPGPSIMEFYSALKFAFDVDNFTAPGRPYRDFFFDQAHREVGNEYRKALMDQLRTDTNSSVSASAEEKKSFDSSEAL